MCRPRSNNLAREYKPFSSTKAVERICKTVSVAAKILAEARLVFDEDHPGFGEIIGVVGPERDAGQGFWIEVAPHWKPPRLAARVGGAHGLWRVFTARGRDEADGGVLQRV